MCYSRKLDSLPSTLAVSPIFDQNMKWVEAKEWLRIYPKSSKTFMDISTPAHLAIVKILTIRLIFMSILITQSRCLINSVPVSLLKRRNYLINLNNSTHFWSVPIALIQLPKSQFSSSLYNQLFSIDNLMTNSWSKNSVHIFTTNPRFCWIK